MPCVLYLNSKYLELGSGWVPAVVNDTVELDFIQQQERRSRDDRSYWIGGLAYDTLESQGYSSGKVHFCLWIKA